MAPQRRHSERTASSDSRSGTHRRTNRPVRRRACQVTYRVTWPRAYSRSHTSFRRRESGRKNPSLTNTAQWYLDKRYPTEGPPGLIYALPELPPSHTADEVVEVLDAAVASLAPARPQPTSPAAWNCPNDFWNLRDHPLTVAPPPSLPHDKSTSTGPLLDLPAFPDSNQSRSPQALSLSGRSLVDTKDLPNIPIVKASSLSVDDLHFSPSPGPATFVAPLVPAPTTWEFEPGLDHLSLAPQSQSPPLRNERLQSQSQVRRKVGTIDLESRAATLPRLRVIPPQRAPACLQVGSPIAGPVMPRKPLAQDSLKLRIPKDRKKADIPQPLQAKDEGSGLSPGPDVEIDCLITAVDVVKESFNRQLDPLEPDLGDFSCDFSSVGSRDSSRTRRGQNQCKGSNTSNSGSSSSDLSSPSQTSTASTYFSPRSSPKKNDSARHANSTRPLPPLPLAPEPMRARQGDLAKTAVSNATLKALLAAEDIANNSAHGTGGRFATSGLSRRSAAVVQDFSDFAHRSFFHPAQDVRSRSDGTLWPQAPSRTRVPGLSGGEVRSASLTSLAMRKKKGRGMVFADDGLYKVGR